jgi:hypothetical protein
VGRLDQFAKEMFAQEVPSVTHGAATWQLPAELNMSEVRLDGLLVVHDPAPLVSMAAPWSTLGQAGEPVIVVEVKMQGDHLDMIAVDRAVLRRQALQVNRREDSKVRWDGETPLVIVASHLPAVLSGRRTVEEIAPGCHRVGPSPFPFLWIAANELPLAEELIPFLIARSGRALDELCRWLKTQRPPEWLARVVEFLPMSYAVYEELIRFAVEKTDDPELLARKKRMVEVLVDTTPGVEEGVLLKGERLSLREVLSVRGLTPTAEEDAKINACTDLATLRRWLRRAVVAASVAEALQ